MDGSTIVSSSALAVSVVTGVFAYRQVKAAKLQADAAVEQAGAATSALEIERRRWVTERTPTITGVVEFVSASGHALRLHLHSQKPVSVVRERLVGNVGVELLDLPEGEVTARALRPGESIQRWVAVGDPPPTDVKLEVVCEGEAGQDQWVLVLDVPVFPELARRKPVVVVELEPSYPLPHHLTLKLKSLEALAFVELSIQRGHGVRFLAAGGSTSADGSIARWHDLSPGSMARWPVKVVSAHSDEILVAIKSRGRNGERWDLQAHVAIPDDLLTAGHPDFSVSLEREGAGHVLVLRLDSLWPLASIEAHVSNLHGTVAFVGRDGRLGGTVRRGRTNPGDTLKLRLHLGAWMGLKANLFDLDMTCTGLEGETWSIHRRTSVPGYL
ncbi:hypothetical protein Ais01nite_60300 [Asanoa ishikariensis]|nr:hypothetical protein [Asanoa ishikariensis]GIF67995.1 hypothetical protein Ais01nite_60300 [Asanoa ishikariensis]